MTSSVLVTGATGNVGGQLVRALAEAGRPPRSFPRWVEEHAAAFH